MSESLPVSEAMEQNPFLSFFLPSLAAFQFNY